VYVDIPGGLGVPGDVTMRWFACRDHLGTILATLRDICAYHFAMGDLRIFPATNAFIYINIIRSENFLTNICFYKIFFWEEMKE